MMKILKRFLIVLLIIAALGVVLFFALRWQVKRVSPMPNNLGVANGRLSPCPESPNESILNFV
jgi:HAMP domain-containing protein